MSIKAIETQYKGYRFRSRLEARWAVFFDALGVTWEYEKEGFEMDGVRYLPDFYLPDHRTWIEIKPGKPFDFAEAEKIVVFAKRTEDRVIVLTGQPYQGEYTGTAFRAMPSGKTSGPLRIHELVLCRKCKGLGWMNLAIETVKNTPSAKWLASGCFDLGCNGNVFDFPTDAYAKARGARFEHGETPE